MPVEEDIWADIKTGESIMRGIMFSLVCVLGLKSTILRKDAGNQAGGLYFRFPSPRIRNLSS